MAAYFLCRECYGTGWIPYYSETVDGELEEAYRLCPNRCAPRCCTRLKSDRPSRSGTVYYGSHYYCEEHIELIYADGNMKHIHEVFFCLGCWLWIARNRANEFLEMQILEALSKAETMLRHLQQDSD